MTSGLCHTVFMLIALLVLALIGPGGVQEKAGTKPPKRGDKVTVRGCLSGGSLDSTEITSADEDDKETPPYYEFVTFRLTGDKKVLKEVRMEHSGHVDLLHGTLGTDLPKPGSRIGNSRVSIGIGRGMSPEPPPPLPVLKVSSFEHTSVTCR
jgi:hypothetical protein